MWFVGGASPAVGIPDDSLSLSERGRADRGGVATTGGGGRGGGDGRGGGGGGGGGGLRGGVKVCSGPPAPGGKRMCTGISLCFWPRPFPLGLRVWLSAWVGVVSVMIDMG